MKKPNLEQEAKSVHWMAYFKMIEVSGRLEDVLKTTLQPFDLTHPQLNILYLLARHHPDPLNAQDLKEGLITGHPDITRLVDRMVQKGFVYRVTCEDNRRKVDIGITEKGMQIFVKAHHSGRDMVQKRFDAHLTESEAKQLFKLLGKIKP